MRVILEKKKTLGCATGGVLYYCTSFSWEYEIRGGSVLTVGDTYLACTRGKGGEGGYRQNG